MKNTYANEFPCPQAKVFSAAEPIWLADGGGADEYAEFFAEFDAGEPEVEFDAGEPEGEFEAGEPEGEAEYDFFVAADSEYNFFLDGRLLGFGQYQDYPERLVYDRISFAAARGRHTLCVIAWHWGVDSFTHKKRRACVAFELRRRDGTLLLASSEATLSRPAPGYVPYKNHIITTQLGLGCEYSAEAARRDAGLPFAPSSVLSVGAKKSASDVFEVVPRPVCRCEMLLRTEMRIVKRGYYKKPDNKAALFDSGLYMDTALLDLPRNAADGCYIVADVGREETGFIEFILSVGSACRVRIGWGEYISEDRGTPRSAVHGRRFTYDYTAAPGQNHRLEAMRRIGCRYIELFCEDADARISYLGIAPVRLPLERSDPPRIAAAGLRRRIYDCAVRTLELCMHEHYEDCPRREQALYTLDSRTQMLCGYEAFRGGNTAFARASLDLISRSARSDRLLSLCAPAGIDRPIPCYSLAYIIQMREYGDAASDASFLSEKLPLLENIISVFLERRDPATRLPRRFPDRLGYWNFYEWAPTLDGAPLYSHTPDEALPTEAPLCAFLSIACSQLAGIFSLCAEKASKSEEKTAEYAAKAEKYRRLARELADNIADVFFDPAAGLFRSFTDRPEAPYAVLTQALCLLCGAGEGKNTAACLAAVASNGNGTASSLLIPATLSSAMFRYDALAAADREKYAPVILAELDRDGKYMLERGATSFWETIKGADDFDGAGSLCHGWSALAALWYHRLAQA